MTTTQIPVPKATDNDSHATCAWCRTDFPTVKDLCAHVDRGHDAPALLRRGFVKAA